LTEKEERKKMEREINREKKAITDFDLLIEAFH